MSLFIGDGGGRQFVAVKPGVSPLWGEVPDCAPDPFGNAQNSASCSSDRWENTPWPETNT